MAVDESSLKIIKMGGGDVPTAWAVKDSWRFNSVKWLSDTHKALATILVKLGSTNLLS